MAHTPPQSPQPPAPGEYLRRANEALRVRNVILAGQIGAEAEAAGVREAHLLQLAAHHYLRSRAFDRALRCARMAAELVPRNTDALGTLGFCMIVNGRPKEASTVLDRALRIAPDSGPLLFNKGLALEFLGEIAASRAHYGRSLAFDARNAEAMGRASNLAALQGDMAEARELGTRALAIDPANIWGLFGLSLGEIDAGQLSGIEARLKPLAENVAFDPPTRGTAHGILGDAFDAADQTDKAFRSYRARGDILRAFHAPPAPGAESQLERVQRMGRYFASADRAKWRGENQTSPRVGTHAFLLGFARSGTTLLEQVLAAHGEAEVMDERDCLKDSYPFTESDAGLDRFAAMNGQELEHYRDLYWSSARASGMALDRPVFVDKMPLNSVVLCLIAKLFPEARIIFSMRDPREVVFSSFRRRFGVTPQLYELLTPQSAAMYYAAVMSLVETYRGMLDLRIHDLRYEDLVVDFDGTCHSLCSFLGLEYDSSMREFARVARARDVSTPSAAQVARGLYGTGEGRWRAYRDQLAPVLPMLAPFVARYGYGEP